MTASVVLVAGLLWACSPAGDAQDRFDVQDSLHLDCDSADDWMTTPGEGYTVILDAVALPTTESQPYALQLAEARDSEWLTARFPYLVPKHGPGFSISVPEDLRDRVAIWRTHSVSGGSSFTWELAADGCDRSEEWVSDWLIFSGGLVLRQAPCIPLVVSNGSIEETVRLGTGYSPCPGQQPFTPPENLPSQ